MGIADFFRPKYRHSDVKVRLEAVRAMTSDDSDILTTVARTDREAAVRRVAIEKIDEAEVLADIAEAEADRTLKDLAGARAAAMWVAVAIQGDGDEADAALGGLLKLGDQRALADVANRAARPEARTRALDKLEDPRALAELARATSNHAVRVHALGRISDPDVLAGIAVDTTTKELGIAAVERFDEEDLLERVAQKAKAKAVRQRARKKLDDIADAKRAAQPATSDATKRRRAEQSQLLREMEALAEVHEWEKSAKDVARIAADWGRLQGADDEAVEERFHKAVDRYHARRKPWLEQHEAQLHALEDKRRAEATAAAERSQREEHVTRREKPVHLEAPAPAPEPVPAPLPVPVRDPEEEKQRAAAIAASLDALLGEMASMLESSDGRAIDRLVAQATKAFEQVTRVAHEQRRELEDRFQKARAALVVKVQELREAEDWQRWANVPRAEALIKEAQALLETEAPTMDQLKGLQARWKELGAIPRKRSQELWDTFKAATDGVFAKFKAGREVAAEKFAEATAVKEALIAQAEALAESTDWEATAEAFKELQKKWKDSGVVPRKQGDVLWKRFRSACDKFFERRKPILDANLAEQTDNLAAKAKLCERAEQIVASAPGEQGWGVAINEIRDLQRRWKDIGFVPRRDADAIYARFRGACDALFAKRDEARDAEANARRDEVEGVRAEIAKLAEAPAGGVAAAIALRPKVRELGDAELSAALLAMLRAVVEGNPDAVGGTELDPEAMRARREKLVVKAEELLPKERATIAANQSPEEIAAALKNALKSNALGDFKGAGRDPREAVDELRASWAEIGPVVGAASEALDARFAEVCEKVLAQAPPREERAPRRDDRDRDRPRREERPRRERRERRPREEAAEPPALVEASAIESLGAARAATVVTSAPDAVTMPVAIPPPAPEPAPVAAAPEPAPEPPPVAAAPEPPPAAPLPAAEPPAAAPAVADTSAADPVDSGWD